MKRVKAKITYQVKGSHPDIQYIKDKEDFLTFEDTYTDSTNYYDDMEQFKEIIKSDLALVAGGGYNTDHIYNISYAFS